MRTERLLMRHWRDADRDPFAALNADPVVMRHFTGLIDRAECDAFIDRKQALLAAQGWGMWAVEMLSTSEFIGFVGLSSPVEDLPPAPCTEIGWRLAARYWGNGYAPEAARAALNVAFDGLGVAEVVSFTTTLNAPSRRVMEKIGMRHVPARDFDHPRTPGWHGQRHVLYALPNPR